MTEPRPYRELREVLPPELEAWLHGGEVTTHNYLFHTKPKQLWHLHRHRIMREHIERKPGTRPRLWWQWEARQMRRRLGGVGDTLPEVFPAVKQGYECGIPKY